MVPCGSSYNPYSKGLSVGGTEGAGTACSESASKAVWGKKLTRDISDDEAIGIIRSFRNFLLLLKEIKCPTQP
jgi:hypothetical protein